MAKKGTTGKTAEGTPATSTPAAATRAGKPSVLLDTRVIYCGDCLEQLKNLPDACLRRAKSSRVDLIYIDPALN